MRTLRAAFDGSCLPANPGGRAAWGFAMSWRGGHESGKGVVGEGPGMTNNIAEWTGAVRALRKIRDLVPTGAFSRVELKGDSQLVVNQLRGEWRVRASNLVDLHAEAVSLIREIRDGGVEVDVSWVRREGNEEADALSRG